jgi:hypothetical protein
LLGQVSVPALHTDWNEDGIPDLLVGSCISEKDKEGKRSTHGYVWLALGRKPEQTAMKGKQEE